MGQPGTCFDMDMKVWNKYFAGLGSTSQVMFLPAVNHSRNQPCTYTAQEGHIYPGRKVLGRRRRSIPVRSRRQIIDPNNCLFTQPPPERLQSSRTIPASAPPFPISIILRSHFITLGFCLLSESAQVMLPGFDRSPITLLIPKFKSSIFFFVAK